MNIPPLPGLPAPNGHYSHCIAHNGLLYLSGQLPIHPESRQIPENFQEQVILALHNAERILIAAGSSKEKIIQCRIYISDVSYWAEMNEAYAQFMGAHKPARTTVPCGPLHFGAKVEVELIALA